MSFLTSTVFFIHFLLLNFFAKASTSTSNIHPSVLREEKILSAAYSRNALNPHWVSQIPFTANFWIYRFPRFPNNLLYHGWETDCLAPLASLLSREAITTS